MAGYYLIQHVVGNDYSIIDETLIEDGDLLIGATVTVGTCERDTAGYQAVLIDKGQLSIMRRRMERIQSGDDDGRPSQKKGRVKNKLKVRCVDIDDSDNIPVGNKKQPRKRNNRSDTDTVDQTPTVVNGNAVTAAGRKHTIAPASPVSSPILSRSGSINMDQSIMSEDEDNTGNFRELNREVMDMKRRIYSIENTLFDIKDILISIRVNAESAAEGVEQQRSVVRSLSSFVEQQIDHNAYIRNQVDDIADSVPRISKLQYTYLTEEQVQSCNKIDCNQSAELFAQEMDKLITSRANRCLLWDQRPNQSALRWIIQMVFHHRRISCGRTKEQLTTSIRRRLNQNAIRLCKEYNLPPPVSKRVRKKASLATGNLEEFERDEVERQAEEGQQEEVELRQMVKPRKRIRDTESENTQRIIVKRERFANDNIRTQGAYNIHPAVMSGHREKSPMRRLRFSDDSDEGASNHDDELFE